MLGHLFDDDHINEASERSDLEAILSDINEAICEDDQFRRQNAILSLSDTKLTPNPRYKTLENHQK